MSETTEAGGESTTESESENENDSLELQSSTPVGNVQNPFREELSKMVKFVMNLIIFVVMASIFLALCLLLGWGAISAVMIIKRKAMKK